MNLLCQGNGDTEKLDAPQKVATDAVESFGNFLVNNNMK